MEEGMEKISCLEERDLYSNFKITRRNQIRKTVNETYLRQDIPCGIEHCPECHSTSSFLQGRLSTSSPILIPDLSVLQNQIDFICNDAVVDNVLLPLSLLDHLKTSNEESYARLRAISQDEASYRPLHKGKELQFLSGRNFYVFCNTFFTETFLPKASTPSYHLSLFIKTASWLQSHVNQMAKLSSKDGQKALPKTEIIILSENVDWSKALSAQGLRVLSCREYCDTKKDTHPTCGTQLASYERDVAKSGVKRLREPMGDEGEEGEERKGEKSELGVEVIESELAFYDNYLSEDYCLRNEEKNLVQGVLRTFRDQPFSGAVRLPNGAEVFIRGRKSLNRAINSDVVFVQLLNCIAETEDAFDEQDMEDNIVAGGEGEEEGEEGEEGEEKKEKKEKKERVDWTRLAPDAKVEGKVVRIVRRDNREIAGSVRTSQTQEESGAFVPKGDHIFVPYDSRLPNMRIRVDQNLEGLRILIRMDSWSRNHFYPQGHLTQILGKAGDIDVECRVILNEYNVITRNFSPAVLNCLPEANYIPSEKEVSKRMDLRSIPICSVDPPGCKDIDDALSCELLPSLPSDPSPRYRIGIHIADVSHFVKENTPIDIEARERSTTVYLANQRTDMLPGLLTTDLCSLVANKDRLTFSVLAIVNDEAELLEEPVFGKAIIHSRHAFTYQQAQTLIDGGYPEEIKRGEIGEETVLSLKNLMRLSKKLRRHRMEKGALELASTEVKIEMAEDKSGEEKKVTPVGVKAYEMRDTNHMVEEMMLLGNRLVAKRIWESYPLTSMLRNHPPPKMEELDKLHVLLQKKGIVGGMGERGEGETAVWSYETSKQLGKSLERVEDILKRKGENPFVRKLIKILTTRCMNQAKYFCSGMESNYVHYGLAADMYTHFTSPIRRYCDLLVHRTLASALGVDRPSEALNNKEDGKKVCDNMNKKHYNAQQCSRASNEFFTCQFFLNKGTLETAATILRIKKNGIHIMLNEYGIDAVVLLNSSLYDMDAAGISLTRVGEERRGEERRGEERKGKIDEIAVGTKFSILDIIRVKVQATNVDYRYKLHVSILL